MKTEEIVKQILENKEKSNLVHNNHQHSLGEWILIIENQLQKAKHAWYRGDESATLE